MATVAYSKFSPYSKTKLFGQFLDVMVPRNITQLKSDKSYTIAKIYDHRPDLLAYDLYGDTRLWWVFAMRNPDVLKDPLFDFAVGNTISLPDKATLFTDLGI